MNKSYVKTINTDNKKFLIMRNSSHSPNRSKRFLKKKLKRDFSKIKYGNKKSSERKIRFSNSIFYQKPPKKPRLQ